MDPKNRCLRAALEAARRIDHECEQVEVIVRAGAVRLRLAGVPPEANGVPQPAERPAQAPPGWRWFSPLEEEVIRAVPAGRWTKAREIAAALGREPSGELKAILRNLVERQVLASCTSLGYRLNVPPPEGGSG